MVRYPCSRMRPSARYATIRTYLLAVSWRNARLLLVTLSRCWQRESRGRPTSVTAISDGPATSLRASRGPSKSFTQIRWHCPQDVARFDARQKYSSDEGYRRLE